jgi:hypothetical protein
MHYTSHPASGALSRVGAFKTPVILDAVAEQAKKTMLDDAMAAAATGYATTNIKILSAAAVQEWIATAAEDLMEGETMADRLFGLMVGIADDDKDGEVSDDEAAVMQLAGESMADYMIGKGATEEDVIALLNDGDDEAAGRVIELMKGEVPAGDDESLADVDAFAFDSESNESLLDQVLDAVYKKKVVVRAGRKIRINKRVSGHVRLNAAQKVSIRKAGRKAHSAMAKMRRAKSMRIRSKAGL